MFLDSYFLSFAGSIGLLFSLNLSFGALYLLIQVDGEERSREAGAPDGTRAAGWRRGQLRDKEQWA